MAFSVKNWTNRMTTRLNAAAMEDLEERLSDYSDSVSAAGIELGNSQITSDATRAATSFADVAGLSTTVTVASRPIEVMFSCGAAANNAANGGYAITILEDGSQIGGASGFFSSASNGGPIFRRIRRAPAAGTHTYKVQLKTLFSGTATITADSGSTAGPASIAVVEI